MSLEEVCAELAKCGVSIDAKEVRKAYPTEDQLARAERRLWQMLRNIEEEKSRMNSSI